MEIVFIVMIGLVASLCGIIGGAVFDAIKGDKPTHECKVVDPFPHWSQDDLDALDRKCDAVFEHLGIEFVTEKVSDGSAWADSERFFIRKKKNRPNTLT